MKAHTFFQRNLLLSFSFTILIWLPVAYAIDLGTLFQVKKGTTEGGMDDHAGIAQKWLDDTETLVNYLLPKLPEKAGDVDGSDRTLVRNLKSWFNIRLRSKDGIHPDDDEAYGALRTKFTKIDDFLKQKNPDWNTDDKKPWLFYNSDWQVETDLYFDGNGDAIDTGGDVIMGGDTSAQQASMRNWNPPNLKDLDPDAQELFVDMKKGTGPDNWDVYSYWSKDLKDYEIVPKDERRGKGGFCAGKPDEHFFALTITKMYVDSITLCSDAFTDAAEKHETIADGIGSDSAKSDKAGTPLQDTSPRSLTLFHELVHLTSDPDATPDKGTKPTECLDLIRAKSDEDARNNPDNIVFFAWSYYLEMEGSPKFRWNTGKKVKNT